MSSVVTIPALAIWREQLWDTILDLSALLGDGSWVLAGGQAVVAHSLAFDPSGSRLSWDFDPGGALITTAASLPTVEASLRDLGFEPNLAQPPRERQRIYHREPDASGTRDLGQTWRVQVGSLESPLGIDQTMTRSMRLQVTKGQRAPWVPVPDLLSCIVHEAEMFATIRPGPVAHARSAVFLTSIVDDPRQESTRLTPSDRAALRTLDAAIGFRNHALWGDLPPEREAFARWRSLVWPT